MPKLTAALAGVVAGGSPFTRTYLWRLGRKGGLADAAAGDSGFYRIYAGGSFAKALRFTPAGRA
jgi:hypothetical protein